MARKAVSSDDLNDIQNQRAKLQEQLEALDKREKEARDALRDAGRPSLLAALDRVKIGSMDRNAAKAISRAISIHGGDKVSAWIEAGEASTAS